MRHALQLIGWLACVQYSTIPAFWLMIHPFADRWRTRRRSPYPLLVPLWIAMWIIMALATRQWHTISINSRIYATNWPWLPALMLFATGIVLYAKSGKSFTAKQLAGLPEIQHTNNDQRLITTGIRARVRHPVYLAHLCEMLAWSVGTGLAICWALTAFAIVTGAVMIRMEDTELEKRFGPEYAVYRQRVPAIVPRVFRPRQL